MPEEKISKILSKEFINHNVIKIKSEKPKGFSFPPAHATEISINKTELKDEKRPFTFTSLPEENFLEFIIKIYQNGKITPRLAELEAGDEIILGDVWKTINYKGKGVFIAGGAGITPFISIFKNLKQKSEVTGNTLLLSNKHSKDIILEKELKQFLGNNAILTLTKEKKAGYESGRINSEFIKKHIRDFNQFFYLCGPMQFIVDIKKSLDDLGVRPENVVIEM